MAIQAGARPRARLIRVAAATLLDFEIEFCANKKPHKKSGAQGHTLSREECQQQLRRGRVP
jgi:hypothetical protein